MEGENAKQTDLFNKNIYYTQKTVTVLVIETSL